MKYKVRKCNRNLMRELKVEIKEIMGKIYERRK